MDEQLPDIEQDHPDGQQLDLNPDAEPFFPRPLAEVLPMDIDEVLQLIPRPDLIHYVDLEREVILENRYEELAEFQDMLEEAKNQEALRLARE